MHTITFDDGGSVQIQYPRGLLTHKSFELGIDNVYNSLFLVPNSSMFLAFRDDFVMEVWDRTTQTVMFERKHHDFFVLSIAFDDTRMLWKTSRSFYLEMWCTRTWQCVDAILHIHALLNCVTFYRGQTLALVGEHGCNARLRVNIDKPSCADMVYNLDVSVDMNQPGRFTDDGQVLTVYTNQFTRVIMNVNTILN